MDDGDKSGTAALDRNLRVVPIHIALTRAYVWLPVFVLFTRGRFGLDGAFLLGALYYLFVVPLEVPSGWMSDRLGRVFTLRFAGVGFVGAHLCFMLGDDRFSVIVLGQFCLAWGFASLSGTDVAFHYDTLEALGRASEFRRREARVASIGFTSTAVATVAGGLLGLIDLRLTFAAGLVLAVAQLGATLGMVEPPVEHEAEPLGRQLAVCARYIQSRFLGWIFFYGIVLVTLEHLAFTMMQPWLTDLLGREPDDVGATPLVAGLVFAAVSFVGAGAARASAPLAERFGTVTVLLGLAAVSAVVVTGMALWVHWLAIGLVLFRSAQPAAAPVLISAAVAPRTEPRHRATLLSINSLGGRLGYGIILLITSGRAEDVTGPVLRWFSVTAWVGVALLIGTATVAIPGWWRNLPRAVPPEPSRP